MSAAAQGEQAFDRDMAALAQQAAQVDGYWQRFNAACATEAARRAATAAGSAWPKGALDYVGRDRNCPYWLNDMDSMSREFEAAMRKASEAARRTGVFPGTMREVRRKYKLDWTGFDR